MLSNFVFSFGMALLLSYSVLFFQSFVFVR